MVYCCFCIFKLAAGFPYVHFCVFCMMGWGGVGWGGLITFNGTCTHRWCYVTDLVSCTCRHTWCYATDLVSCTCRHTWCYATDLVACTCTHRWCYATDLVSCACMMGWGGVGWADNVQWHLQTYVMLRYRPRLLHLQTYVMLRYRPGCLHLHT